MPFDVDLFSQRNWHSHNPWKDFLPRLPALLSFQHFYQWICRCPHIAYTRVCVCVRVWTAKFWIFNFIRFITNTRRMHNDEIISSKIDIDATLERFRMTRLENRNQTNNERWKWQITKQKKLELTIVQKSVSQTLNKSLASCKVNSQPASVSQMKISSLNWSSSRLAVASVWVCVCVRVCAIELSCRGNWIQEDECVQCSSMWMLVFISDIVNPLFIEVDEIASATKWIDYSKCLSQYSLMASSYMQPVNIGNPVEHTIDGIRSWGIWKRTNRNVSNINWNRIWPNKCSLVATRTECR